MDAKVISKANLPSRHTTVGPSRAPHRSYLYAMGLSEKEIAQPLVGVAAANGTPREFCTITVTDGIAMGHQGMKSSLVSRECIADSVELTMRGHCYDALVGLAGCDKSLPGMMMAMVRLNVPSIFIYGGSILPGSYKGRQITVQDVFEAVGQHSVGDISDADLLEIEMAACPSAGSCGAQFTANTMATVAEAIGLSLPYSCGALAKKSWNSWRAISARATLSLSRHWKTPPPLSLHLAARPMARCIFPPSRMKRASSLTCSTWPKCSSARHILPT
jgi:dihydroxy-acid dehydratase